MKTKTRKFRKVSQSTCKHTNIHTQLTFGFVSIEYGLFCRKCGYKVKEGDKLVLKVCKKSPKK